MVSDCVGTLLLLNSKISWVATLPVSLREQQTKRLKKFSKKSYPGPGIFKHQEKLVYQYADLTTLKWNVIWSLCVQDSEGNCVCAAVD